MELPLLDLFYQLRDEGFSLSIEQYYRVADYITRSVSQNHDLVADPQKIKRICQTVWVKSPYQQQKFDEIWQELLTQNQQQIERILEEIPKKVIETQPIKTSPVATSPDTTLLSPTPPSLPPTFPPIKEIPPTIPQVATAVKLKNTPILKSNDRSEYYPVSRTLLETTWQQLHPLPRSSPYRQIDIETTVIKTSKQGFFTDIAYQRKQQYRRQVILLIDRSDSMIPFAGFGRLLNRYWDSEQTYYFENIITEEVFLGDRTWESIPLTEMLRGYSPEQTVCVIYSDAGAARGRYVSERSESTEKFIRQLTRRFARVAWLNPLPSQRWFENTAIDIADLEEDLPNFAMFPLEIKDFTDMVTWLKAEAIPPRYIEPESTETTEDDAYYSYDVASRIRVLELDYGESTRQLARYAAFPLGLTPELLYYLRQNLATDTPWYAVADILLSSLVHRVDTDLYEMEREVRQILLEELEPTELEKLARFLQTYISDRFHSSKQQQIYAQTQTWTALAYLQPGQAVNELKQALKEALTENNRVRLVRLSALVETLCDVLKDYEPLLTIAEHLAAYARGDQTSVQEALQLATGTDEQLQQGLLEQIKSIKDELIPLTKPNPQVDNESFSKLITPDNMPAIRCNQVTITADLNFTAVSEASYKELQRLGRNLLPVNREEPPIEVSQAFKKKNAARAVDYKSHGVQPERAIVPLVRLIANPIVLRDDHLILRVSPISWDLYSVTIPYPHPDAPSDSYSGEYKPDEHLLQSIRDYKAKFPLTLHQADDKVEEKFISPRNFVPLGLEALVVTNDNYALLRYKDKTTTIGGGEWDVSFSGYARFDEDWCVDLKNDHLEINLERWARREFWRETAVEEGLLNVEDGLILGLHCNTKSGAIDILAYFRVHCTAKEIAKVISINKKFDREVSSAKGSLSDKDKEDIRNKLESEFEETYRLEESEGAHEFDVRGTQNWFIPFMPEKIKEFFAKTSEENKKILPEAKQVIKKALEEKYKGTKNYGKLSQIFKLTGD